MADCRHLIRVGTYGAIGTGKSGCAHCGYGSKKGTWKSSAKFQKHVNVHGMSKSLWNITEHSNASEKLGPVLETSSTTLTIV